MENFEFSLSALKSLVLRSEKSSSSELSRALPRQIWTSQDHQCILSALAQLLLDKEYTLLIGRQLQPLLLDLLQRNADTIRAGGQINLDLHERLCVAMSKLVGNNPDVLPFALQYCKSSLPVFQRLFLESSDPSMVRYGRKRMKLRDLMEAAFRFLQHEPSPLRDMWDWSVCMPLLRSHDTSVRWYTANCLALVTCMNDEHKLTFLKKTFSSDELIRFKLKLLEEVHMQNVEKALVLVNPDTPLWHRKTTSQHTEDQIVSGDLSASVVAVCGVVLPKRQLATKDQESLSHLVLVESTCKNLQSLAVAISFRNAVLLEGPIGCGKTALVEHMAALTGRTRSSDILKVQLGDQTDSKILLGMYRCTDIPGEFVWQPGTLTQAVINGHWILLEDIDYAPLDVISVLIPLLESGELVIPGRGDCLKVAPGFQFFATRRLLSSSGGWYRQQNSHAVLLDKYWTKIQLDNMSQAELKEVLLQRYPSLAVVADRLLEIYVQLTGDKHRMRNGAGREQMADPEPSTEEKRPRLEGRGLSLRDLLKWCNRIVHNFDGSSPETALNVFHEALDCFTAMLPKQESRLKMAEAIGSKLNISKKKAEYYCLLYKPALTIGELEVTAGRVEVLRKQTETLLIKREKQTFAATRPSSLLLEQLALCINRGEPVLLVGETGTGKTSTVQYLAKVTGHRLRVVNMNQQSDTSDLLGGYKPVDHRLIWLPLREGFEELFMQTFSRKQNATFLGHIQTCYRQKRWHDLLKLMQHVLKSAVGKESKASHTGPLLKEKWERFDLRLKQAQQQMKMTENALVFAFVEGTLTQAVKKGEWILLDEINLAAAETLECLSGLLEGCSGSLVLLDRGDTEPLVRHPDFRLFACMNPATDVGKRNLPPGIRNRFTELYVEELENEGDLQILIMDYLRGLNMNKNTLQGIINFYLCVRKEASTKLVDGTGHRPHYSLRTLCRALRYAAANPCKNIQRSLYEGFCLGFLTQLDRISHPIVQNLISHHIVHCSIKNLLKQSLPEPEGGRFVQIEGYWIPLGTKDPFIDETYILTASVKLNLKDLVRVVSAGTYPVLIQGETSVGKTSLIRWLAAASGNHCVRINNHEHTDIQEYIGCYTSDVSGKLVFREGVLIDAMRKGYWIILDELNLAPTDVLEALNRLLDDNRELFITETQEVVKAHPRFMLFATQNPPGAYGGRKMLSRAFRNRFVELHYNELPSNELEIILHKRCSLPPSYCAKLVRVMLDLQSQRRGSTVFAGKHGFITLRDLFRWAERYRLAEQTKKDYDWLQHLANDGFMLLAGRVRKQEEVSVIKGVLEKHFKKKLDPGSLFSEDSTRRQLSTGIFSAQPAALNCEFGHIVWTQGMRRLAVLVGRALEFGEPVLLVGDTGCGKTTICQVFAALADQDLYAVNCHLHMETSDFLGGLRPIRQRSKDKDDSDSSRLFEWHDGPLVLAMKEDGFFLLDEISLADDSVLERLNSVLEVEKTLVLAEKGSPEEDGQEVELLTAGKKFHILATMNPGGDFGKKELSPALRNRFTEIWCPQSSSRGELIEIIQHNLHPGLSFDAVDHQGADIAELMMDFIEWLLNQEFGCRCILSIRDILSWVNFMNVMAVEAEEEDVEMDEHCGTPLCTITAFVHSACLVYVDGIGSGTTACSVDAALLARKQCLNFLSERLSKIVSFTKEIRDELRIYDRAKERNLVWLESLFGIHPFYIPRGPVLERNNLTDYTLSAGTTAMNAQRLLRALKLSKPILLEGSPGVGKTSLVAALAKASGNHLIRINLSEQTDITDLFGTDLPVEGGRGGEFAWRDGPLLAALKAGHWIVLDELNLASQSVLEGLNACFDHRAEVYIPELGMTFQVQHEKTKIFGCQNPYRQGGGRKGLPKSFLNRFTQVYVDQLSVSDMEFIANTLFPAIGKSIIAEMVAFNNKIEQEVTVERGWGQKGGPWEFNLRDLFRWCQLIIVDQSPGCYDPGQHMFLIYGERMRTKEDREKILSVFREVFGSSSSPYVGTRQFHITPYSLQIGYSVLSRGICAPPVSCGQLAVLHHSLQSLETIMKCVQMGWMVILVGPAAVGKTSLIQLLALLTGHKLKVLTMNSAMDTTELLGGFEQVDINRPWQCLIEKVENTVRALLRDSLLSTDVSPDEIGVFLQTWSMFIMACRSEAPGEGAGVVSTVLMSKLEGVLNLIQRQNNKINTFSKAECSSLVKDFHCFKQQLLQSVEGCSHGAFEWVDGMLVQALQTGDWLLMDNVNFCSSSVLDRLNALLEPGGSLIMSERGVIDGSIPTVVPHPNFRLFLSMDPLHGEISRAMRNRGVEIYVPGEGDGNVMDQWDVKFLLHGLGLMTDGVCDALLAVHSETKEILAGSQYSLSSLVRAAMLIAQQLQRGLGLVEAFQGSCSEVYACSQHSQVHQKHLQEIISRQVSALASSETWGNCLLSMGLWPDSMPSALFTAEDSILSTVLRDGQVLMYCLNRLSLKNSRTSPLVLQDLQKVMQSSSAEGLQFRATETQTEWLEEAGAMSAAIKLVTERATNQDWTLRVRWLHHLAKNVPQVLDSVIVRLEAGAEALNSFYTSALSSGTTRVIKLLQPNITDEHVIPLDPRWNMQSLDIIRNSMSFDTEVEHAEQLLILLYSVANRVSLFLNRRERAHLEKKLSFKSSKKPSKASALRMSVEFRKDPGHVNSLPHTVVAHLATFFELWDSSVLHCVQSNQTTLTDDDTNEVLYRLQWRDRFWAVADMVTVDPSGLALLSLHWHWIVKHHIDAVPQLLIEHEQHKASQEIQSVSLHLQSCLASPTELCPRVKKLQKMLGRPLPYKDEVVVQCVTQLNVLGRALDVLELRPVLGESTWHQDISRLRAAALGWRIKKDLLCARGLVLQANHSESNRTDELKRLVDSKYSQLKAEGVLSCRPAQSQLGDAPATEPHAASLIQLAGRVQLWPALEYLTLLWQYKLTADIIAHTCSKGKKGCEKMSLSAELRQHMAFCLRWTYASSQQLQGLWYLLHFSELPPEELSPLWSELVSSVLGSFWSSTVTTDAEYWLSWKPAPAAEERKVQKFHMDPSVKGPGILSRAIFSKCFFEVLTSSSRTSQWDMTGLPVLLSSHVTLGEWIERTRQLEDISMLLWSNMTLSSKAEFRSTDSRLQGWLLCRQLMALKEVVPGSLQDEYVSRCGSLPSKSPAVGQYIRVILMEETVQGKLPDNVLSLLLTCLQQYSREGDETESLSEPAQRGCLWVNMGLLQIQVWLPQTMFDPAVKREHKLKYAKEELHELESEWKMRNLLSQLHTGRELDDEAVLKYSHPHIRLLQRRMQHSREQISSLLKKQAYRPQSPSYDRLYQEIHYYVTSIAKVSVVQDLLFRLLQALQGEGPESRQGIQNLLSEEAAWQLSHHHFRKRLAEEYALYPDVVTPLQAAILQMQHGMRLVASEVYMALGNSFVSPTKLAKLVTSLLSFPSVGFSFPTYLSHADTLCSVNSLDVLRGLRKLSLKYPVGDSAEGKEPWSCPTQEQLLVSALLYLRSHVLSKGELDQKSLKLFRHICQAIINEWDEQEHCAQEREQQESSLYRYRSKSHGCGMSEDEEEEREFRNRFPLYEKDFADVNTQPTLEEKMEIAADALEDRERAEPKHISHSSMQTLILIHQQICLSSARSLWYQQNPPVHQTKHYLSAFLSCYQTSAVLLSHFYPLIGAELNDCLLGSQLLASTLLQNTVSGKVASDLVLQHDTQYDFYQHPNIQQVIQCQPVLNNFTNEVNRLLKEWPEHPALLQLLVVMDRIRGFPLSSPLAKFLNGLEILLAKSQDWEENASRTLSLRKHLNSVTQLIIQWRKLELNCWSLSLDNAVKRHTEKSTKHWFSIYQLIEKYLQGQAEAGESTETQTLPSLVATLQAFIEGSTLGEFHTRLRVLLVFHCHILLVPQVERKASLFSVLWNLYNYYKQFSECVQARITELRLPLEKELKAFVNISKWNDASFWSVKQSVEKTHRTLFKYMKKFEAALSEPCLPSLLESTGEQQLDCIAGQEAHNQVQRLIGMLRETLTLRKDSAQQGASEESQAAALLPTASLQHRLPKLTKRIKKLCSVLMEKSLLPDLLEGLDLFTGDVIVTAHELQNMTVDQTADKDWQKSQVKHILMQKQRALSDLFKTLARTGLSYRKGLTWSRSKDPQDMLSLHPLNLRSALAILSGAHELDSMLHVELSSAWDGCEKYFYRSLARHARLQTALSSPAKEIGLGNIERCKGFTAHLLKLLVKQRKSLTALTEQWIIMRNLLSCVQEISTRLNISRDYSVAFPPQDGLQQWMDRLQHLSMQCIMVLEQLYWFLQCCPSERRADSENSTGTKRKSSSARSAGAERDPGPPREEMVLIPSETNCPSPISPGQLPLGSMMRKQDHVWQREATRMTEMLSELKVMKAEVDQIRRQASETLFYSWKAFEVCSSGFCVLVKISSQLQDAGLLFTVPEAEGRQESRQIVVIQSIDYIQEQVDRTSADFTTWKTQLLSMTPARGSHELDEGYVDDFSEQVDVAIRAVLCAIQSLLEKRNDKEEAQAKSREVASDVQEEVLAGSLHTGHLTKLLTEDLAAELNSLHVQKIISAVSELVERLKSYGEDCTAHKCKFFNQCCYFLIRLMPMLSTYSDLLLFYLTVSLVAHRSTGKLLSVLAQMFTELALKGFCLPKELMEEAAGEGATQFHDYEGGGIGEGEGMKDVSDKIENEEQVEDTYQKGQEKEKEDQDSKPDVKEEDNAIEMSEDFDGKMHDGEHNKKGEEDEDEESESEDDELDKQMGDLGGAKADILDERLWGDEEDSEDHDEAQESGPGMDEGESELVAKDDNVDAGSKNKDNKQRGRDEEKELEKDGESKEKIHEQMDEREYDENEVDPYHGNQEEQSAAEAVDLPEDLNLENKEKSDDEEGEEENPYEIEEKPMDVDTADGDKNQEEEEESREGKEDGQEPEKDEEETTKDLVEEESNAAKEGDDQRENKENEQPESGEDDQQKSSDKVTEKEIPDEQGLKPQKEDDEENPEKEDEAPACTDRMEHESCGQTGEDNLQSESATELAGAASEKDQAKEEHGSGAADASQAEGHESKRMARLASQRQSTSKTQSFKRKPGQADNERTLGDRTERVRKRLRTVDSRSDVEQNTAQLEQKVEEADAYEHMKEGTESYDAQTYDVASKEQQKLTKPLSEKLEENEEDAEEGAMEIEEQKDEELEAVNLDELKPENIKSSATKMKGHETELEIPAIKLEDDSDTRREQSNQASDDEKPERSRDSTIHTAHQFLVDPTTQQIIQDPEELRLELERQLEVWQTQLPGSPDEEKAAAEMWQRYLILTAPLSQQLCEQLRLILEPTQAAKLKGDYRTGKRLNMRKVIPYIASQFRKDKIWLRRTKPSKRQYQICLAIDDSSSMIDNHSKQLAFESLAVIGNALTLLEVGQIAVYSFGETVQLLHPFHEQFSDQSGARILRHCRFQQRKTYIAQFLESSANMFAAAQQISHSSNPETAQLLLIVSDGRGLFLEGKERVTAAVRAARNANIFVIFVVLDNPSSRDSILDIKVPIFGGSGEMLEIRSYMDEFPFPFYIILRDVNALPETLSDALRQWFELVTASEL